ncbi:MAG: Uma2 family endonuclease [Candidatus Eremiobacteraeota bacterium]|nr:Uma2 family endonuclease [Candidatus Eremiobacteraeota bacterium]
MEAPQRRYTYADRLAWAVETRWELIDGVAYAMSSSNLVHQALLGELFMHLKLNLKDSRCRVVMAPFDVKFSDHDVVQPDLLVSCSHRLGHQFHDGPPDLCVEILSPSTQRHDRMRKLRLYAAHGVSEYWLVTPSPLLVEVLENVEGAFVTRGVYSDGQTLPSPRFPELELNLDEVLAALPPQPPLDEVRETTPVYAPA